ncbi:MAG: YetF domain-containing protein [Caulobacteraceae bacterium]
MDFFRTLIGPDDGYQTMAQLSVRAVAMFVFGILCIRIAGRRTFSQAAPLDIIVYLIVGSNLSRVMTGGAHVLPSMAATLTLVVLHRLLAYATLRETPISALIKARATVLVRDGVVDGPALAREGISEDDLLEALRLKQVERAEDARLATLERGGKISVLPKAH